jgi:Cys-tRNA(Pro)/Cys-tRNA(Cys) deacylase
MTKTNALRQLDAAGIKYETRAYDFDEEHPCGARDDLDPSLLERIFKTLVTRGERSGVVVFCIPIQAELDMKKCAVAAGDKRVEMIHLKELTGLTGYVRSGCSPVGMKKHYPVIFDETALLYDEIWVSAGQRGLQMLVGTEELAAFVDGKFADVITSK